MPELPEVEVMRRYLEAAALEQEIRAVRFYDELDKIYHNSREELREALEGARFTATERTGKFLFVKTSRGPWLHLHFGMSGTLELFRGDELPQYTRLTWDFASGERLAFRDMRKFGVIALTTSPAEYLRAHGIGPDLLEVDFEAFEAGMQNRSVAIKTALLDQKHFSGIGNWIADEMLFDCGIHPQQPCRKLSTDQYRCLWKAGRRIVETAVEADTHYGDFPAGFFVNYRKKGACHPDWPDSPVEKLTVGGRGTFIVPARQKLENPRG